MRVIWKSPFGKRPLEIVTLCPMGIGTCILIKMLVEKIMKELGIPARVTPATESNPFGTGGQEPDVVILEGLRMDSVRKRVPKALAIEIVDLGNKEDATRRILSAFQSVGWVELTD